MNNNNNNNNNNNKDLKEKETNNIKKIDKNYNIEAYDYKLPAKLIATTHANPRDTSKLLYYDSLKDQHHDLIFKDIIKYFNKDDILVLNDTKVKKTFLKCTKSTGSVGSLTLLKKLTKTKYSIALHLKNPKVGTKILFEDNSSAIITKAKLTDFEIEFESDPTNLIENYAIYTLPHYIKSENVNRELYQTIYSKDKKEDSIAAPTAGLHFTKELLERLKEKGVKILFITLHVGLGTFSPIKVNDIRKHNMHSEEIEITKEVATEINKRKGKLILVGTTTLRTLESFTNNNGILQSGRKSTQIFIYPSYNFNLKFNGIITNFHLPKSTLLMLISTLIGREKLLNLYKHAINKKYKFYSLGDATFLNNLNL